MPHQEEEEEEVVVVEVVVVEGLGCNRKGRLAWSRRRRCRGLVSRWKGKAAGRRYQQIQQILNFLRRRGGLRRRQGPRSSNRSIRRLRRPSACGAALSPECLDY